jgi:flagellar basal body rod protein FlgB
MFDLPILTTSSLMLRHASRSHEVTASNIARADVPGAKRKEIEGFADAYARMSRGEDAVVREARGSIDIERELFDLAAASGQRDAGASIWKSTLTMLRMAIAAPR